MKKIIKQTVEKWSADKLFIGVVKIIVNMATVSWAVYTILAYKIIKKIFDATNGELIAYLTSPVMIILISGWVTLSVIMGCNLQKAIAGMIENAKITAEFKAGAQINTDTAKVMETLKAITTKEGGR